MSNFRWNIVTENKIDKEVELEINDITYIVSFDTACLSHCLALLHDAVEDLNTSISIKNFN